METLRPAHEIQLPPLTFINRITISPMDVVQEVVTALGFHVDDKNGEMFTAFYEIFMDEAVIDILTSSRNII